MKLQGVTPQIPSIQPHIRDKPQFVGNAAVLGIPFYEGNGNPMCCRVLMMNDGIEGRIKHGETKLDIITRRIQDIIFECR